MRATQARVGIVVALGLLALAAASVPTIDRAGGELIPPLNVTREAADPSAGVDAVVAWRTAEDEGVRRYLEAVRDARIAQEAADARRARDAQPRADRGTRRTTASVAGGVWAALRQCENGGSYTSSPGDRYRGAYQFDRGTWAGLGYEGDPASAAPAVQDQAAQELQARSGWGQWPRCARRLGLLG